VEPNYSCDQRLIGFNESFSLKGHSIDALFKYDGYSVSLTGHRKEMTLKPSFQTILRFVYEIPSVSLVSNKNSLSNIELKIKRFFLFSLLQVRTFSVTGKLSSKMVT